MSRESCNPSQIGVATDTTGRGQIFYDVLKKTTQCEKLRYDSISHIIAQFLRFLLLLEDDDFKSIISIMKFKIQSTSSNISRHLYSHMNTPECTQWNLRSRLENELLSPMWPLIPSTISLSYALGMLKFRV